MKTMIKNNRVDNDTNELYSNYIRLVLTNVSFLGKGFYSINPNKINNFKPVAVYSNLLKQKELIFKDNKGKSGIYCWVNKVNGKTYIDSSVNLRLRLERYYRTSYIAFELIRGKSLIYSAILKYDYINFQLEILEYCTPENVLSREQYYFDLLKPEYNINPIAGSRFGVKHIL